MKIKTNPKVWWRFLVPMPAKPDEEEQVFLGRARDCLAAFWDKYTYYNRDPKEIRDAHDPFRRDRGGIRLDFLKEESFSYNDFELLEVVHVEGYDPIQRRFNTNAHFFVGTPQDNYGGIGIVSLANANKPESEQEMRFLKGLWKKLDYKPK